MDSTKPRTDLNPLRIWGYLGLFAFLALLIGFGVIVEMRSAFQPNRQTDLGVYLRAAWAVRAGENPYAVTDDNGWHFCYPPVVALLLYPFADAPVGVERSGMLPWPVLVALWYVFGLACLFLAVHWITKTLEARSSDPAVRVMPAGRRRWWFDRVIPVVICLVQVGNTLARGQVNFIVILCVAGSFAALMEGKRLRSGVWLSAAICLKVIPAFLLLFPLWRRDGRMLAGAALGLVAGLFVIPSLYWGLPRTLELNREMVQAVLHPGLGQGGDQTRAKELTNITATDNQSFQAILHNYQYWGRLNERPGQAAAWTGLAHWGLGAAVTGVILLTAGWRRDDDPVRCLLFLSSLLLLMALVTPVSHLHYFAMAVPLVMALNWAARRPQRMLPRPAMVLLFTLTCILYALPSIPIWPGRREAGLPMLVSLVLMGLAAMYLHSSKARSRALQKSAEQVLTRAA